ncbi:MAG: T9SS type A sorting domain-containing protein [bacterium]|nr:T9SS type A sorting domain-containing protein [bacterium]
MKILKPVWILSLILFCAPPLWAQWTVNLTELTQHLDSICAGSGHPLADGTEIRIYHDRNSNGPDAADTLLTICDSPPDCEGGPNYTVNYNTFGINGRTDTLCVNFAGGFDTQCPPYDSPPYGRGLYGAGDTLSPNRIYLRVCFGGRHYDSQIITPQGGNLIDVEIASWTCVEAPCPGCETPPTPAGFSASDSTSCTGVTLHWHFTEALDANVDSVFLYRGATFVGRVHATLTDTTFVDTTAPDAAQYTYSAKSRRDCDGGNYAYSPFVFDAGAKYPSPPTITFGTGAWIATNDSCNAVRVSWYYGTNAGVDSFIIQRNGVRVGAMCRLPLSAGTMTFIHTTTDSTHALYRVCGWNAVCGVSNCSVVDTGWAKQPPPAPAGINATDGNCKYTTVTWSAVSGVTSYRVYRYDAGCSGNESPYVTILAPTTTYIDSVSTASTNIGYKVSATNLCGEGPKSACENGYRVTLPVQVTGMAATKGASCDTVTVTWSNLAQEQGYKIRRRKLSTGVLDTFTVAADTAHYFDLSAVPGDTYYYRVAAYNVCGTGAISSNDSLGYRLAIPVQVQNVQADSTQCARVTITWNNLSYEDSFQVRRSGVRIGKTLANVLTYQDSTGSVDSIYNYTVVAYNKCGVGTVSTPNAGNRRRRPGQAMGLSATDTRCDSIRLTWNTLANTDSFRIYRSGVYLNRVAGGITAYNDLATAGATYGYRILPVNACGNGDTSVVESGTRLAPPPAVATITASDSVCGGVQVTWTNVAGEDSFQVLRNNTRIGVVPFDTLHYTDNTATAGTRYKYEVRAFNACSSLTPTVSDSGTRHATPPQVLNVQASDSTQCWGVQITWNTVADKDSFIVKRNGGRIGAKAANVLSFDDSTAVAGTIYSYTVLAKNVCGVSTDSTTNPGNRKSRPGLATGLDATDTLCDSIRLTWNPLINTERFRILRNGVVVDSVLFTVTAYNDHPAAGTYAYRILPVNACGLGDTSVVESGTRLAQPPAVATVTASDSGCGGVLVSWADVAGEDSFQIRRDSTRIGMVLTDVLSYSDTSAVAGTRYKYEVAAYNACGAAAPAFSDSGGRRGTPGPVVSIGGTFNSCDNILLTWSAVANVDTYYVYRNTVQIAAVPPPDTFYVDSSADSGLTYNYYVRPRNSCGYGTQSGEISGLRLVFPSVPVNLAATQDSCDKIRVTWDSTAGDVDSYRLIRDGTDSVTVSKDSTGYDDFAATPGQHAYRIQAVSDQCGASAQGGEGVYGTRLVPAGVPANVSATDTRCDSIVITWDTAPGDVDGYILYEAGNPVVTVGPDTLRYAYVPNEGGGYLYTVRAFSNECGPGNLSAANSGARLSLPTPVTGLTATVNRCDSVRLQWNQGGGTYISYIVRRDAVALDTVEVLHYSDTASVGSAQYDVITYSVYCGESAPTSAVTGTRLPAPVSPDTVDATTNLCDSVIVTWTAGGSTVDSFRIYRDHVLHAAVPSTIRRYAEAPTSGVTYMYAVTAWDSVCGEAAALDSAQGMRQADASVPQNLVAANACDAVEVSWNTATGAVAEYRLYRNAVPLDTILPPATTYSDTSVERGVTYTYAVSAFSAGCGETALSLPDSGMRLPLPVQVLGLTASDDNCAGIQLNWNPVTGTQWYRVYRAGTLIDSVSGGSRTTTYLDTGVAPRSTHSYKVRSANICGEGALSDSAAGTRYDVPDAVTEFSASDSSCVAVYLIWEDVANDTGYVVYRDGSPIDTVSANDTAYVDNAAAPGAHTYMVKALNECGLSAASDTADALRIPGVAIVTGVAATSGLCYSIDVTWTDLTNETGYVVWRDTTRIDTLAANVTTLSDLVAPGTYTYQITAFNVCGEGLISAVDTGYRAWVPPQVTMISATQDSCTSVTITWTDVATEQFYLIYRTDAFVDTVNSNITSYVDQPLLPGSYIYQVRAGNYCGNGLASTGITGRVPDVPAQVTGVVASDTSCHAIYIQWNDLPDESHYRIYFDGVLFDSTTQNDTTYVTIPFVGLHRYAVQAVNACGVGDTSIWVWGERQGVPIVQPQLSALDTVCGQVTVYWLTIPDAINYTVFVDGDSAICTADTFFVVTADSGLHAITVKPWNECGYGQVSAPKNVFFRSTVPQVTGLTADTMNCLTITLHWTDVANDTGYTILRGVDSIGHVGADVTTYVDSPASPGTYSYQVKAINQCGYGSLSNPTTGRRRGAPLVTTVTATDTYCDSIVVSWTNVADELGYYVFQNGLPVDTVGTDTLSVTLTPPPGAYAYTVQPFNNCGLANMSAVDSGHRLTNPGQVTGVIAQNDRCDSVYVLWNDLLTETRYVVFRDADSIATVGANVLHYLDAPDMGTHSYRIRADNACGSGAMSDSSWGSRVTAPTAPTVTATDTLCGQIVVSWEGAAGDVDGYIILRNSIPIDTVNEGTTTLTDDTAGTHVYSVIAYSNNLGCGSDTSASDSGHGHITAGVPTGLTFVQPEECDSIRLTWTASTGEVEGYIVYRDGDVNDTVLVPAYIDGEPGVARTHDYAVAAYNLFCGASDTSAYVEGRVLPLAALVERPEDTLYCRDTVSVALTFCLPVDSVVAYLSVNGGPYSARIGSGVPTQSRDTTTVIIPRIPDQIITPNCGIRIISYRSGRVDTLDTDPFVIHCDEAADENLSEIPKDFFLDQNYPNPFNPATNIRFGVPRAAHVTIEIFDILGRKMATLINGTMPPGIHTVTWDCSACPSGMYIIRMNTGERVMLRKTLLMK